jgi:hypothetical protein
MYDLPPLELRLRLLKSEGKVDPNGLSESLRKIGRMLGMQAQMMMTQHSTATQRTRVQIE